MGALPQEVVQDLGGIKRECHPRYDKLVYKVNIGFLHSYGRFSVYFASLFLVAKLVGTSTSLSWFGGMHLKMVAFTEPKSVISKTMPLFQR